MKISPRLTFKSLDSATSGFPESWHSSAKKCYFKVGRQGGVEGVLAFPISEDITIEPSL